MLRITSAASGVTAPLASSVAAPRQRPPVLARRMPAESPSNALGGGIRAALALGAGIALRPVKGRSCGAGHCHRAGRAASSSSSPLPRRFELPERPADFESRFEVAGTPDEVMLFHFAPGVLRVLTPPVIRVESIFMEPVAEGNVNEFEMYLLGLVPLRWRARLYDVSTAGFTDVQEEGPMESWIHRHSWKRVDSSRTEVVDQIWFEHKKDGLLTRLLFNSVGLTVLFQYRRLATALAIARRQRK